jgi:hypothetical protein
MIWFEPDDYGGSREALCRHLAAEIAAAYGDFSPEHTGEIAQAVAAYCVQWQDESTLSSDYIAMLVSRALRAAGEEKAARHFSDGRNLSETKSVFHFRDVPPALWSVFASRLIRPSRWLVDHGRVIWTLDLSRFRLDADLGLELAFHQAIRAILYAVAEIWDESSGAGILGLSGIARRTSKKKSAIDVQILCRDLLERIKTERGWTFMPRVLNLDIAR